MIETNPQIRYLTENSLVFANPSRVMRLISRYSTAMNSSGAVGYYRVAPNEDSDGGRQDGTRFEPVSGKREDLPYKVELWDEQKVGVERVLAIATSGSIGYAAYYAAVQEYPDRYITLRHENQIVSRWNAPSH
jgi:hypothetical protein